MEAVLLRPNWPASFRRVVRDKDGKELRTLVFEHHVPQLLEGEDLAAVAGDIGKSLVYAAADKNGNPTSKPDWKKSEAIPGAEAVAEPAKQRRTAPKKDAAKSDG